MKVIIINGSARKGNTLTAIEAFVKGASEKNAKNEILNSTTTFGGGIYSRTVKVYSFI